MRPAFQSPVPGLHRLLLWVVGLAVLPCFVVVAVNWQAERKALLNGTIADVKAVSTLVALQQEQTFLGVRQLLEAASAAPSVRQQEAQRCSRFFASLHQRFPDYGNLGAVDLQGRLVCSAVRPGGPQSVADRSYFQQALQRRSLAVEFVIGRVTGKPSLTFALPVQEEDGAVVGVVFAALDLQAANRGLASLPLRPYLQAFVLASDATVLAATPASASRLGKAVPYPTLRAVVLAGKTEFDTGEAPAGRYVGAVHPISAGPLQGLSVAVRSRVDLVLAPATRRLYWQLAALTMTALGGASLAFLLGHRRLVVPASRLLTRMKALEQGQPPPPAEPSGTREMEQLDLAFSRMHEQLVARKKDRQRLLAELSASQQQLLAAQRISQVGYWELDLATGRLVHSPVVTEILGGASLESQAGARGLLDRVPPLEQQPLALALERAARGDGGFDVEHRVHGADGKVAWVRTLGELQRDADGRPVRVYGSIQDISLRKQAEERLRRSDALLQMAGKAAQLGGWSIELPGRKLTWSEEVARIHGMYTDAAAPALETVLALYPVQERKQLETAIERCASEGQPWDLELRLVTDAGESRWVRVVGEAERDDEGRVQRIHGALQDISRRKFAEQSAQELTQRLSSTLESITDAFFTLDDQWRFTYVNRRAEQLLQRDRSQLLGQWIWSAFSPETAPVFRREYERAVREQHFVAFEAFYEPLALWAEVTAYPSSQGLAVYFRDVSERKKAEQERQMLLARERSARREAEVAKLHFRALFESAPGLYLVLSADGEFRIVAVSEAYLAATYTRREDIIGRHLFDIFPGGPDGGETPGTTALRQSLERVLQSRRADVMAVTRYPVRRSQAMGGEFEERYWSPVNSPVFGPEGTLDFIIHRVEDVTEFVQEKERQGQAVAGMRRLATRAEQMEADVILRSYELKRLNEKLQAAHRIAQLGSWEHHLSDDTLVWSEEAIRIFGSASDAPRQGLAALLRTVHEHDRARLASAHRQALETGHELDVEYRVIRPDGLERHVHSRAELVRNAEGHPVMFSGTVQDVTERRADQARLATQLARLELLHRITRAIGDRMDIPGILRIVVDQLAAQMPLDLCASMSYHPHEQEIEITCTDGRGRGRERGSTLDEGLRLPARQNGLARAVQGELVYEPDVAGLGFDFTDRLASAGIRGLVLAPLRVESTTYGLLMAGRSEAASFTSTDCEFLGQLSQHVALAMRQAQLHGALQHAFDELRRTQEAVLQHERLRALGEMASGIAHDINNAISPVTLYTESLLRHETGISPAGRSKLEIIQLAIQDVAETVTRMGDFYRREDPAAERGLVSLNLLVTQVLDLTRARWRDVAQQQGVVVEVTTELQADLPEVTVNESEIREALTNLVLNAVDAMPQGGTLTLRTREAVLEGQRAGLEVSVADTGVGMDEPTRLRAMEPFFTTKGKNGTGLGLAVVYGIVRRHQGTIVVQSAPGQGTTVTLGLPLGMAASSTAGGDRTVGHVAPPVGLRVLVVDDDPLVLRPLAEALEHAGCQVTPCADGQAAIDACRQALADGRPFDAVITDLGMPKVDGSVVAHEVKAMRLDTWVVMLTGWGKRMSNRGETPVHVDRLLSKPPRIDEVLTALDRKNDAEAGV